MSLLHLAALKLDLTSLNSSQSRQPASKFSFFFLLAFALCVAFLEVFEEFCSAFAVLDRGTLP